MDHINTINFFLSFIIHLFRLTNPHAWEEANRNLIIKRPKHAPGLKELHKHLVVSHLFTQVDDIELPDFDVPILAGAVGSNCSYLWTSDKQHFGKWDGTGIQGVTVVASILLADIMIKKGWKP
jgi:hypothetical protein